MRFEPHIVPQMDRLSALFEHSITWEDDLWRADPVDVEAIHGPARRKFAELLGAVTSERGPGQARILLFHGQSGAGKTHLIRALRTAAHRAGKAYFGYAQMTPDVAHYADYYLRRLVNSLEKPYDPDQGGESGLARLTNHLVGAKGVLDPAALEKLRDAKLSDAQLAKLVLGLADEIVAAPRFADQSADINIVRCLLYLQRSDPRIDQRVRQYLYGRQLADLAAEAVAALDPNTGEGRAFEIIEALGRLMWTVDRAALVFAIDQVEDLRFFDDYQERFQKAARDLIQLANRVPTSIVLVSCLGDFYGKVRETLTQSYVDRIEKAGPVPLIETRTAEEARLIISRRLEQDGGTGALDDPSRYLGPQFYEEFGGLSTRRILELAQARLRAEVGEPAPAQDKASGFISTLAAALGFGGSGAGDSDEDAAELDFRDLWERFTAQSEAEIPPDDRGMLDVLTRALALAREEWGRAIDVTIKPPKIAEDLPAVDFTMRHDKGFSAEARIFLCNRPTQGGGFKRQLDRALPAMMGKNCFMLRASDFPPNKKNQSAQAFRKFREGGGRSLLVPITDWERMMMVREFHAQHRNDPGFAEWFQGAKLLSGVPALAQILRLDLIAGGGKSLAKAANAPTAEAAPAPPEPEEKELPLSMLLDEWGEAAGSILAGRALRSNKSITLNKGVLKRHTAVLGGSGSGKTTLALCIIEQLLLKGTPAVLI